MKDEAKWIGKIEAEMQQLRQEMDALNKLLYHYMDDFTWIIGASIEGMSLIRYYVVVPKEVNIENLEEGPISCLETLEEKRQSTSFEYLEQFALDKEKSVAESLLELGKLREIPFGEVAALLLEKIDSESLRKIIPVEAVLRTYGTEEATRWEQLLKSYEEKEE